MRKLRITFVTLLTVAVFASLAATSFACQPTTKCTKKTTELTDYTVRYLELGTEKVLAPEKKVGGLAVGTEVTEKAIDIDGYKLHGSETQKLVLKGKTSSSYVTSVRNNTAYSTKYRSGGNYSGYYYCYNKYYGYSCRTNRKTCYYPKQYTWTCKKTEAKTNGSNIITFYYEKDEKTPMTTYVVRYLDIESFEALCEEKAVEDVEIGSSITETAVSIDGYDVVQPSEMTMIMKEKDNEFIFYYIKRSEDVDAVS